MDGSAGLRAPVPSRWAALFWPGLTTLVAVAILLGLGSWQLQRRAWKLGLLAEIARGEAAAPVPLGPAPTAFGKVEVTGHLLNDRSARYGTELRVTAAGPTLGSQVLTPLARDGADTVLVERGWLPDGEAIPPGPDPARIVGYVRFGDRASWLAATDNPAQRRFFTLDPTAIGTALGLPHIAPFAVVALGPAAGGLMPATALPRPPNDHLGYALTWFGLAVCLLGVFAAYAIQVRRR